MPKKEAFQHSILIVSTSEQFDTIVKKSLTGYLTIDTAKSGAAARRRLSERDYDLLVVNTPLPDELGTQIGLDFAEQGSMSILYITPKEIFEEVLEQVTDQGIMVLPKPAPKGHIDKAVRYLTAMQNRFKKIQKKTVSVEEKMEEIRIVSRAKLLLVERRHLSEEEAHRMIGKEAMDHGISRRQVAEKLLTMFTE